MTEVCRHKYEGDKINFFIENLRLFLGVECRLMEQQHLILFSIQLFALHTNNSNENILCIANAGWKGEFWKSNEYEDD